jgi:predicted ATPase
MLTELELKNFRGFSNHKLPFKELTIIVGRNNAGKSTIVEALRLISIITSRFGHLNFRDVPRWLEAAKIYRGLSPDVDRAGFDFKAVFHHYKDPPAEITASFANRVRIKVFLGPESAVHAVVFGKSGQPIQDKSAARSLAMPVVCILPQVAPLQDEEELLREEYVRRTVDSHLASSHFRNQLHYDLGAYRRFRQMVELTWPGVRIRELNKNIGNISSGGTQTRTTLSLLVQNEDFVAEASRMGHGLQMWLQTIWFLARTPQDATVILDEPDVYMHPDLQRRLLRLVSRRHKQTIIATHSTEIISDVGHENVLVIDKSRVQSQFTSSVPDVQDVIDSLGGVHNLQLARLSSAKRFLVVEGKDIELLGPIHSTLFPESNLPLESIPWGAVGGWGGWERAVGAATAIRKAYGTGLTVYSIFDSDYHPPEQIADRYRRAQLEKVHVHVWSMKELENYMLIPAAISRAISARTRLVGPSAEEVATEIDTIVNALQEDVTSAIISELHALDKAAGPGPAYKAAKALCASAWSSQEGRWAIASGKTILSKLSEWSKAKYDVSFGPKTIARGLNQAEIHSEVRLVLDAIDRRRATDKDWHKSRA